MHHYLNMAARSYDEIKNDDPLSGTNGNTSSGMKLKTMFYALRGAMACKWIMDKEDMPPILFKTMLEKLELENPLKENIYSLIELKSTKNENYTHKKEVMILDFIGSTLELAKKTANSLKGRSEKHIDLDTYFRNTLKTH